MTGPLKRGDLVMIVHTSPDNFRFLGFVGTLREKVSTMYFPGGVGEAWAFDPPLTDPAPPQPYLEWVAPESSLKLIPPLEDLEGVRAEDSRKTDLGEPA